MRLVIRFYAIHDGDLMSLFASGVDVTALMRSCLTDFAAGDIKKYSLPQAHRDNDVHQNRVSLTFPEHSAVAKYIRENVRKRQRCQFCKIVLRQYLASVSCRSVLAEDASCAAEKLFASETSLPIPEEFMIREPADNKANETDKKAVQTRKEKGVNVQSVPASLKKSAVAIEDVPQEKKEGSSVLVIHSSEENDGFSYLDDDDDDEEDAVSRTQQDIAMDMLSLVNSFGGGCF